MNQSFGSIYILSDKESTDSYNGSLRVNGGIGVKKNIIVGEDIRAKNIIATESITARNNIYISGYLTIASTLSTLDDKIVFEKDIISSNKDSDTRYSIGTVEMRWENIYVKTLNCYTTDTSIISTTDLNATGNIILGDKENPTIILDVNAPSTAIINGNMFFTDKDKKVNISYLQEQNQLYLKTKYFDVNGLFSVNKDTRHTAVTGYMSTSILKVNNYLQITPQIVTIEKEEDELIIYSSIIFLKLETSSNITLLAPDDIEFDHTIVKIIIKESNNNNVIIYLNTDKTIKLTSTNKYIELFYENGEFQCMEKS